MHCPFTLFKKQTKKGPVWYARFWDERASKYAHKRSTRVIAEGKKERRYEAERAARKMLPGIKFERVEKKTLIQYLKDFWAPDSAYAKEAALVKKRPLSAYYIQMNHEDVRRANPRVPGKNAARMCQSSKNAPGRRATR